MFSEVVIANRGENAVRVIRACKEMGVATVAVYSQADAEALHVALADESYCIGGPEASESYLKENQIVSAALLSGAQAIHPGYGFLSENAHFARLCRRNGLAFIGPDPASMERLSDKAILKRIISDTERRPLPGARTAVTLYLTLAVREDLSLVECELITGRTHQIRAQFAATGHPLLGDGKYGRQRADRAYARRFQALWSYKLTFHFTTDAGILPSLNGRTCTSPQVDFVEEYFPG